MAEVATPPNKRYSMGIGSSSSIAFYKRQLLRFLILGSEKGTYQSEEPNVTEAHAACVTQLLKLGEGLAIVEKVKKMVERGRSIRMNAPLLVLAMCCRSGDDETKKAAYMAVYDVCTIPTHLFKFLESIKMLCPKDPEEAGAEAQQKTPTSTSTQKTEAADKKNWKKNNKVKWNRSMEKTVTEWYTKKSEDPKRLAMLVTKYRKREGWTHKDVLKSAHIKSKGKKLKDLSFILCYISNNLVEAKKRKEHKDCSSKVVEYLEGVEEARTMKTPPNEHHKDVERMVELIEQHRLLREHVPSGFMRFKAVWQALVKEMPTTALLKNLNRITSSGMLDDEANRKMVLCRLDKMASCDGQRLQQMAVIPESGESEEPGSDIDYKSLKIHPYAILTAWYIYKDGQGRKNKRKLSWTPVPAILDGLERLFYQAFGNVEPTNKRIMIAVDVSQSMGTNNVSGSDSGATRTITARVASAAMCLVTLHAESSADVVAFSASSLQNLELCKECKLEEALNKIEKICPSHSDERLDCARPILWATENKKEYDAFIIYTDNNTEKFRTPPDEALRTYRQHTGIKNARLAVVGMSSSNFCLADPNDQDMLDVVGFDLTTPNILHDFISGCLQGCE